MRIYVCVSYNVSLYTQTNRILIAFNDVVITSPAECEIYVADNDHGDQLIKGVCVVHLLLSQRMNNGQILETPLTSINIILIGK